MSKQASKWILGDRVYLSAAISRELWFVVRRQGERQTHLFFLGWYAHPDTPAARLYSVTLTWLSFKVGFNFKRTS